MFKDFKEDPGQMPRSHNEVVANDKLAIMQKVAPNFGVTIKILAEEGKRYSNQYTHRYSGQPRIHAGIVPEGNSYINISSQKPDLSNFYNAVQAKQKAQQPPANPPKI